MDEQRTNRLRRLVYQASYTGMKETDLLLGHFAKLRIFGTLDRPGSWMISRRFWMRVMTGSMPG